VRSLRRFVTVKLARYPILNTNNILSAHIAPVRFSRLHRGSIWKDLQTCANLFFSPPSKSDNSISIAATLNRFGSGNMQTAAPEQISGHLCFDMLANIQLLNLSSRTASCEGSAVRGIKKADPSPDKAGFGMTNLRMANSAT
jgi:hypothetical protein